MNRRKILQLINSSSSVNGLANIIAIAKNIDKSKFEVSISSNKDDKIAEAAKDADAEYIPVKINDLLRSKYIKTLLSLVNSEKYDLIHSHGHSAGIYSRSVKKRLEDLKCVHTFHGIEFQIDRGLIKKNLDKTIEQYLTQYTDMAICESHNEYLCAVKNRIAGRNKTEVIPPCINIGNYANRKSNENLRRELGFEPDNFVVGNISEFNEFSNQKVIIQAAYFLIRKYPKMRFVFCGDGRYMGQMKDLARESKIEDHIVFFNNTLAAEELLFVFDIFVFPYIGNQLPVVVLQAMASRLPVICSHYPELLEIMKPGYSALTVNPLDMDDLFQKISALYQNPVLKETIAQNALIESTGYDVSELVPKISRVYEEVLLI